MTKKTEGILKRYDERRAAEIEKLLEPLREALHGSALAYTISIAQTVAAFCADTTNTGKALAAVATIISCHEQETRRKA